MPRTSILLASVVIIAASSLAFAGANPTILIWDNDGGKTFPHPDSLGSGRLVGCETLIRRSLIEAGYIDITVMTSLPSVLDSYGVIFICLRWRDTDADSAGRITPEEQTRLADFLANTGPIYIEGNDFARDYQGTAFLELFGAQFIADGLPTGNLPNVNGVLGTFTEGLQFDYLYGYPPDSYVDEILPGGPNPGFIIFEGSPCRGIARLEPGKESKVANRTVFLSFVFGALKDGSPPNQVSTKVELMSRIMEFFGFGPTSVGPEDKGNWGRIKEMLK